MAFCLKDYVGLRPCNYIPSLSGMYVDQLPGMTVPIIDGIATEAQSDWIGAWDDIQETTADTFREDVIQEFNKRYLLKQVTQTVDLGKNYSTNIITTPVGGHQYGLLLETKMDQSACACSNLQKLYVQSISFYWSGTNPTPALTLTFVDADLGTTIQTTVANSVMAGWNDVWIDTEFDARRMYVFASGNCDNYVQLDISQFFLNNFYGRGYAWGYNTGMNYAWANFGGCGCQARIQGIDYSTGVVQANTNTFGMSVVLSTRCSFDSIVCANKRHFASAWQHCLAIETLNYRINSPRLNRWTTITKEQAISLQTLFTHKYRGGVQEGTGLEYPGKLQSAITGIILNDSDCCLQSNDRYIWREVKV